MKITQNNTIHPVYALLLVPKKDIQDLKMTKQPVFPRGKFQTKYGR